MYILRFYCCYLLILLDTDHIVLYRKGHIGANYFVPFGETPPFRSGKCTNYIQK